jgi:hypothetical protein
MVRIDTPDWNSEAAKQSKIHLNSCTSLPLSFDGPARRIKDVETRLARLNLNSGEPANNLEFVEIYNKKAFNAESYWTGV